MKNSLPITKGVDYWTKRISEQEMPALCSTVRDLEKLAKDDVSSLATLGRSVLHDNALTTRILRVANSAIYNKGTNHVTTVSRAAVVLGFDTIRNICITAKLLTSLLENNNLSESVYQRLIKLMAHSFQAAMISRVMLKDYDEALREEVFIASLLYRIGESAFWSIGGEFVDNLDQAILVSPSVKDEKAIVREHLGTSFSQLTQSIARAWGLGDVLTTSLSHPDERMPEIRTIFLANEISEALNQPHVNPEKLNDLLLAAAEIQGISLEQCKSRISRCAEATMRLAEDYGATELIQYLPDTAEIILCLDKPEQKPQFRDADLVLQLKKLRELTEHAIQKADFNQVVQTALEGILDGVGVDRCAVMLLSLNRKQLSARVVFGEGAEFFKQELLIDMQGELNPFSQVVDAKKPSLIHSAENSQLMLVQQGQNEDLNSKVNFALGFMVAPIVVNDKVIGVFYADKHASERPLSQQDFDGFCHLSQLANLCFGLTMK
ncbi:HDOD domain-containing protein [Shewanella sp. 10N.286.52.A9]|uniref:HDOD domain-containing protein n=1 Tax=Shewanella sp. 10N.286.52.A9 TaxID=3229711 RepID=UPI0035585FFE